MGSLKFRLIRQRLHQHKSNQRLGTYIHTTITMTMAHQHQHRATSMPVLAADQPDRSRSKAESGNRPNVLCLEQVANSCRPSVARRHPPPIVQHQPSSVLATVASHEESSNANLSPPFGASMAFLPRPGWLPLLGVGMSNLTLCIARSSACPPPKSPYCANLHHAPYRFFSTSQVKSQVQSLARNVLAGER